MARWDGGREVGEWLTRSRLRDYLGGWEEVRVRVRDGSLLDGWLVKVGRSVYYCEKKENHGGEEYSLFKKPKKGTTQ